MQARDSRSILGSSWSKSWKRSGRAPAIDLLPNESYFPFEALFSRKLSLRAVHVVLFAYPPYTTQQRGTEKQKHSQSQHTPPVMPEYQVRVKGNCVWANNIGFLPGWREIDPKEIRKDLAINFLLKFGNPVDLKLARINPAELRKFSLAGACDDI
jgi:hypothetical protein